MGDYYRSKESMLADLDLMVSHTIHGVKEEAKKRHFLHFLFYQLFLTFLLFLGQWDRLSLLLFFLYISLILPFSHSLFLSYHRYRQRLIHSKVRSSRYGK